MNKSKTDPSLRTLTHMPCLSSGDCYGSGGQLQRIIQQRTLLYAHSLTYLVYPIETAMAQAVSRSPLTVKFRVRYQVGPCEFCGGQSGRGSGFPATTAILPYDYHSTNATYTYRIISNLIRTLFSFRGLKNQMRIRIACGLDSRSRAGFWKNDTAAVRAVRTIQ